MQAVQSGLARAALPALGLAIGLLLIRLLLSFVFEDAAPLFRLGYIALVFLLLAAALFGANFSAKTAKSRNPAIYGALLSGLLALAFLAEDWEAHSEARFWGATPYAATDGRVAELAALGSCGENAPQEIILPRQPDGHYYTEAVLAHSTVILRQGRSGRTRPRVSTDCTPVNFLVDTGASGVSLVEADARRLGVDMEALDYFVPIGTATSTEYAAPVVIHELNIGGNRFENVPALVHPGRQSLLGMAVLERFDSVQIARDRLVLTP